MKIILKKEDIYQGDLILINAKNLLSESFKVNQLESFNENFPDILLDQKVLTILKTVLKGINAQDMIVPVSGYRTKEEQTKIIEDSLEEFGEEFTNKFVAKVNASEHQTGLAIDLGLNMDDIDFICPSFPREGICETFRQKSIEYGFIERYKQEKESITEISAEEWHFRYVGLPHSIIMTEKNLCLEEYISLLKKNKLTYLNYEISFIPYKGEDISLDITDEYSISGNNIDGFILTQKVD